MIATINNIFDMYHLLKMFISSHHFYLLRQMR
nr:MAG TPA: hypothetical protein [Caudoviricetes sp.]